jgi:hypothetical protein
MRRAITTPIKATLPKRHLDELGTSLFLAGLFFGAFRNNSSFNSCRGSDGYNALLTCTDKASKKILLIPGQITWSSSQ